MLLDNIPGLKRAVAAAQVKEETIRRRAFLPCSLRICGIDVRPFTPRHYILLDESRSPFLGYPGEVRPEHVVQFLWVISIKFVLPTHALPLRAVKKIRAAFVRRIAKVKYLAARKQIKAYLDEAFLDAPPPESGDSVEAPYASMAAHLVQQFHPAPAAAYDAQGQTMPDGGTLDLPWAQLWQRMRVRNVSRDPNYYPPNPLSDKVERQCVQRWVNRQAKRRKKA